MLLLPVVIILVLIQLLLLLPLPLPSLLTHLLILPMLNLLLLRQVDHLSSPSTHATLSFTSEFMIQR